MAQKWPIWETAGFSLFCLFFSLLDLTLLLPNGRRNGYYLLLLLLLVNPSDGSLDWRFLLNYIIKPIGWEPLYLTAQALNQGLYYNLAGLLQGAPLGAPFHQGGWLLLNRWNLKVPSSLTHLSKQVKETLTFTTPVVLAVHLPPQGGRFIKQ